MVLAVALEHLIATEHLVELEHLDKEIMEALNQEPIIHFQLAEAAEQDQLEEMH